MTEQSAAAMQTTKASVPVRYGAAALLRQLDRTSDSTARRAFKLFESNGRWFGRDRDSWFRAEEKLLHPLPLEVTQTGGEFPARAEMPCFSAEDLEISLEPRCLKIAGKRKTKREEENGKTTRWELCADPILRAIELPADVDTSKASAGLKDGLLSTDLPKSTHAKAVRIESKPA